MNSNNDSCDEYIKIDPNMDITWGNVGKLVCENSTIVMAKRVAELRQKAHDGCIEEQGTPQ